MPAGKKRRKKQQKCYWECLCESVRGASHEKSGRPNQDSVEVKQLGRDGAIAAVADGHGSEQYFRSDIGAKLAVNAAINQMEDISKLAPERLRAISEPEIENYLAGRIVQMWAKDVHADVQRQPFSPDEITRFPKLQQDATLAYGSTLLAVCAMRDSALFLQIGDGDMLIVSANGKVSRAFSRDPQLIGNETTSLCSADAIRHIRVTRRTWDESTPAERPALIFLATDGYSNCFQDDAAFIQVGSDVLGMLQDSGTKAVKRQIGGWLRTASDNYSRDDITVAMLYHHMRKAKLHPGEKSCLS